MAANEKITAVLSRLLGGELTAINQYTVHSELCDDWGCSRLRQAIEHRLRDEMRHSEALIQRLLALGGRPDAGQRLENLASEDVLQVLRRDRLMEQDAVAAGEAGLALVVDDQPTHELLTRIIADERQHLAWIDEQLAQIERLGVERYTREQRDVD